MEGEVDRITVGEIVGILEGAVVDLTEGEIFEGVTLGFKIFGAFEGAMGADIQRGFEEGIQVGKIVGGRVQDGFAVVSIAGQTFSLAEGLTLGLNMLGVLDRETIGNFDGI